MKKKVTALSLVVFGIAFVVYNLFVFLFLSPEMPLFWISYGFMVLAFVLQIVGMYLSFKDFTVQAAFFGIPLAEFTLFYFFAELFMSVVFMFFQHMPVKIPVFLQVVLLAVYAVVAVVSVITRDTTVQVKDHYQSSAAKGRMKTVDIEILCDQVTDPELKNQLRRLAETVRYSDPMTNDVVADVDARIHQEVDALRIYCEDGNIQEAKASCSKLSRLYLERNKKLLASK